MNFAPRAAGGAGASSRPATLAPSVGARAAFGERSWQETPPSRRCALGGWWSGQCRGQFGKVGRYQVGLVRGFSERPPAPVDEGGAHAECFGTYAVKSVVGHEQDARAVFGDDLLGLGVGFPMRLEIAG